MLIVNLIIEVKPVPSKDLINFQQLKKFNKKLESFQAMSFPLSKDLQKDHQEIVRQGEIVLDMIQATPIIL